MCNNEGFSRARTQTLNSSEREQGKTKTKTETKQIASKRRRDTLDNPTLTGPTRRVGYISSLCVKNQHPPAERPKCATTKVSVEDNSQIA